MAIDVPTAAQARASYTQSIALVPQRYRDGVNASSGWQAKAAAAEGIWAARVQEAAAEQRRARAIQKVSDADWKNAALNIGASRIGPGMTANSTKYEQKMSGVLNTIAGVTLPPRTADVNSNIERVRVIANALHDKKGEF